MVLNCNRCCETIDNPPEHIKVGGPCPLKVISYGSEVPCGGRIVDEKLPRCTNRVSVDSRGYHFRPCGKPGKFTRQVPTHYQGPDATMHFCGQHDPEAREARRKARGPTAFERELAARDRKELWISGMEKALMKLSDPTYCSCTSTVLGVCEEGCVCSIAKAVRKLPE